MKFTPEQLTKAKTVESAEELLALAKENGIEMTEDEAQKYYVELHKEGNLADAELANVSGGCGGSSKPSPKYKVGQEVLKVNGNIVYRGKITEIDEYNSDYGYLYRVEMENGVRFLYYLEASYSVYFVR